MRVALLLGLLSAIFLQSCKIVDPSDPTPKPARLVLVPDTVTGASLKWTPFEVKWSDSTRRAERYLWDFGDGSTAESRRGTSTSHFYARKATYRVNVMAFDSKDSVISIAQGVAIISSPTFVLRLDSSHYTVSSGGPVVFRATLDPKIIATYEWTLDADAPIQSHSVDSIVKSFDVSGHHMLRVAAIAYDRVVARDSAEIDVVLPSISLDDLVSFGSLDVYAIIQSDTLQTTFSLLGGPGNFYSHSGSSFVVTSMQRLHVDLGAGRSLDTAGVRRASWDFVSERYLDSAKVSILDSNRIGTQDTALLTVFHASFCSPRLTLKSIGANEVVFEGGHLAAYSRGTDTVRIVPPSRFGGGCPVVGPSVLRPISNVCYIRFTFRPAR